MVKPEHVLAGLNKPVIVMKLGGSYRESLAIAVDTLKSALVSLEHGRIKEAKEKIQIAINLLEKFLKDVCAL